MIHLGQSVANSVVGKGPHGKITVNPCERGGKLYRGTRVDKIWSDEDVTRFLAVASPQMRLAMALAINTGERQGDLLKLAWSAYDGSNIKVRQRKTGAYVPVPVSDELRQALDAAPKLSPLNESCLNATALWRQGLRQHFPPLWQSATARPLPYPRHTAFTPVVIV
jgi:integrase